MAVEKAKVLAVFSTKFKGKSLSKTFLDKTATRYAAKIETDADIDDYINEREEDIIEAGVEADRRVTAALKKPAEGDKVDKTKTPAAVEIDDDELKDAPAWAKAIINQNKELVAKVAGFEAQTSEQKLASKFETDERLKGIDKRLFRGRYPKTEEEFEEAVTEAAEELKDFAKPEGGEQQQRRPFGGGIDKPNYGTKPVQQQQPGGKGEVSKTVMDDIKKFTSTLQPTPPATK